LKALKDYVITVLTIITVIGTRVDPFGHYVTEPVWNKEKIIYVNIDMEQVPLSRMEFDGTGHYSRPDVLELVIHEN